MSRGHAELGVVGDDAQIAGHGKRKSTPDGRAVDRRDRRLFELADLDTEPPDGLEVLVPAFLRNGAGNRFAHRKRDQHLGVRPAAEAPPCPGEDQHAHIVVLPNELDGT